MPEVEEWESESWEIEGDLLTEWGGIPVMPEATAGMVADTGHGPFYLYTIEAEPLDVVLYYAEEMTELGWEMRVEFDMVEFERELENCRFEGFEWPPNCISDDGCMRYQQMAVNVISPDYAR